MKQPDFAKLFSDYFGEKPKKVRYELREPPYFLHDLVFLSSLVHDARFFRKDIVLRSHRMTIPLNRDCWEIPRTAKNELYITNSKLVFSTVQDLKWTFQDIEEADPNHELWIQGLCVNESYRSYYPNGRFDFIISGVSWELRFTLDDDDFIARLQDDEEPYLYSERNPNKSLQPIRVANNPTDTGIARGTQCH